MDSGFANLQTGGLEISNVNITDELTSMIKAQQQFNGSARLMQANSDMIEKTYSIKLDKKDQSEARWLVV